MFIARLSWGWFRHSFHPQDRLKMRINKSILVDLSDPQVRNSKWWVLLGESAVPVHDRKIEFMNNWQNGDFINYQDLSTSYILRSSVSTVRTINYEQLFRPINCQDLSSVVVHWHRKHPGNWRPTFPFPRDSGQGAGHPTRDRWIANRVRNLE